MKRKFYEMRRTLRAMKSGAWPYNFSGGINWNYPGWRPGEIRDLIACVMLTL